MKIKKEYDLAKMKQMKNPYPSKKKKTFETDFLKGIEEALAHGKSKLKLKETQKSKMSRSNKSTQAEAIASIADSGKNISKYFTNKGKMMAANQNLKVDRTTEKPAKMIKIKSSEK